MSATQHHGFTQRIAHVHAITRLLSSIAVAAAAGLIMRHRVPDEILAVATWDVFALVALALTWTTILALKPQQICVLAQREDPSRVATLVLVLVGASAALLAVIVLLQQTKTMQDAAKVRSIILALSAVALAWFLIHTVFTLRYAHLFHDADAEENAIDFPGDEKMPDYIDFAYFAFVIGMTAQTADVAIRGRRIRRTALVHGVISFTFNTAVVALSIGVLSSILS